jgi:hypothetical protein
MNRFWNKLAVALYGFVGSASVALADPLTLDVTPITSVLEEGPEYLTLIAGAIFLTIGLMFIISKVRQLVKA